MSKAILIVSILFALTGLGCAGFPDIMGKTPYLKEYDFEKTSGLTPKYGVTVYYPTWMQDAESRSNALIMVDSYVQAMVDSYPNAAKLEWDRKWVYLHDEVGDKIVCQGWGWVWGWQSGRVVYTPWRPIKAADGGRIGIAEDNCLIVVPHEFTHMIAEMECGGDPDTYHTGYFQRPEIIKMIADGRANAVGCKLTEADKARAMSYVYIPWQTP